MSYRNIDKRGNAEYIQLVREIETRQHKEDRVKSLAFWTGVVIGTAGTLGVGVAYNRYQANKNLQ